MAVLQATLALYREAGRDTLKALPRSGLALVFLLLAGLAELLLMVLVGGSGMAGGLIVGFADAFLCGWYLALLRVLVVQNRTLRGDDVRETLGVFFMETLVVGFVIGIPRLILQLAAPDLVFVFVPVVALLFNPIPEMIYQDPSADAVGLYPKALGFMRDNWPEWLAGQALVLALVGGLLHLVTGQGWLLVPVVASLYGPWLEFMNLGGVGASLAVYGGLFGLGLGLLLMVFTHGMMVFRGALYKRLSRSSRRSRAWQARMG